MIKVAIQKNFKRPPMMRQTPGGKGVWGECEFFFDDTGRIDYDWFIAFNYPAKDYELSCPKSRTILISMEPPVERYDWHKDYFDYFGHVLTQFNVDLPQATAHHPVLPWLVDRDYEQLSRSINQSKPGTTRVEDRLVCITSDKVSHQGHKDRLDFIELISKRIKVDVFGRGFKEIDDKATVFEQYKYALVVENAFEPYYWSEKIGDALLSGCLPFYYGCPNLEDYLPGESFRRIDIFNTDWTVEVMRNAIEDNAWQSSQADIAEACQKILNELQFFPILAKYIQHHHNLEVSEKVPHFIKGHVISKPPGTLDKLKFIVKKALK